MPFQRLVQIRFEDMKADALDETVSKLPQLICDTCKRCTTFGGSETFVDGHFTILDVCMCHD